MISARNVFTIFKKEFLQLMRNKSVVFTNFFIPLFAMPLYAVIIFEMISYQEARKTKIVTDTKTFKVSLQGDIPRELLEQLKQNKKVSIITPEVPLKIEQVTDFKVKNKKYTDTLTTQNKINLKKLKEDKVKLKADYDEMIKAQKAYMEARIAISKSFNPKESDVHIALFKEQGKFLVYLFYDDTSPVSVASHKFITETFDHFEENLIKQYKQKLKVNEEKLNPITLKNVNLVLIDKFIIRMIGILCGASIMFLLLIAIFNPTINTTIGERDDHTYKVLLMNPVSIHEIFLGKYINVAIQGLLTLVPYFIEVLLLLVWGNSNYFLGVEFQITGTKLFTLFLGTISSAILISALCFLVSSFAKSKVQAQSLLTLLLLIILIPTGILAAVDLQLSLYSSFIPLLNFPLITEQLLHKEVDMYCVLISFFTNIATSILIIWFSIDAFVVQWKDSSSSKSMNDLLSFKRRISSELMPVHGFFAFALCFLGYTYGGTFIGSMQFSLFTFLFPPLFFCIGTSITVLMYSGLDFTKVLKWDFISINDSTRIFFSAIFLSCSINLLLSSSLISEIFKFDFPDIFTKGTLSAGIGYFLLFALIPAVSEEILFRGIIFKSFRKQYSFLIATVLSSVLFAIIHFSLFKWGHTFVGGLFLAYLYEKKGLFAAIFMHLVFNSTALWLGMSDIGIQVMGVLSQHTYSLSVLFALLAILCLGKIPTFLLRKPSINL